MHLKSLILFLFIRSTDLGTCFANYNLELVQVLFRHGERTFQKNEINLIGNKTAGLEQPWGLAQLTSQGKIQEYRIGTMLRKRYDEFLGVYQPDKVYAYSSAFDRTKTSLQLVLASLYPPSGELVWKEDLKWIPIPIHFVPLQLDALFYPTQCPMFKETWQKLMNTSKMENELASYDDVITILEKYYPHIKFDFHQLFYMNNALNTMRGFNLSMPVWYTSQRHANITRGAKFYLESLSYTQDLIRLNGGALTRRLVENMNINGKTKNPRKIYLYSGHELNLYAVSRAHGITLTKSPAAGSAIIFETLRDSHGELYVRIYHWTGEDQNLIPLPLSNCNEYCKMEDYLNLIKLSLPSDDEMLCLYKNLKPTDIQKILSTDTFSIPI